MELTKLRKDAEMRSEKSKENEQKLFYSEQLERMLPDNFISQYLKQTTHFLENGKNLDFFIQNFSQIK